MVWLWLAWHLGMGFQAGDEGVELVAGNGSDSASLNAHGLIHANGL